MRRAVGVLVLWLAGCAATPVCKIADGPRQALLWEVTGKTSTVWLFGTVHSASADEVPAIVWAKLDQVPVYIDEIGDIPPGELERAIRLPPGQSLMKLLPADTWMDLKQALAGVARDDDLARLRPWWVITLIDRARRRATPAGGGATGFVGMERGLRERAAKGGGRTLEHLETFADQLPLLETLGPKDIADKLADRVEVPCAHEELVAVYRAGDEAALAKAFGADPSLKVAERNRRWVDKIEPHLTKKGALVVVGVSHLLGDDGLPALLRARGFQVRRVAR